MKGNRAVLVAVVAVVLIAGGWWLFRAGSGAPTVDLIDSCPARKSDRPNARLQCHRRQSEWRIAPGDRGGAADAHHLEGADPRQCVAAVNVGLKPEAWTAEGDGVLFFVGVSDGRTFDKLFEQVVNPFNQPGDRKWIPVMVDLASYAGEEVEVIFNTREQRGPKAP